MGCRISKEEKKEPFCSAVRIVYTNHEGKTSDRIVIPQKFYRDSNRWYPECQWLMDAFDLGKQAPRTFAMAKILKWENLTIRELPESPHRGRGWRNNSGETSTNAKPQEKATGGSDPLLKSECGGVNTVEC